MTIFPTSDEPAEDPGVDDSGREGGVKGRAWRVAMLASGGVAVGALAVALIGYPRTPPVPAAAVAPPVEAAPPAALDATSVAPTAPSAPVGGPKWIGGGRLQRFTDGSRMVAFELKSERYVPVWRQQVHPTLHVRCLAGVTEVFVSTGWPASFERDAGRHSVRLAFDDNEVVEQWLDSEDYKALFAPDGVATARRLARARTLRFGFTPFNASPVVVDFDVRGFDALVGSVARACRWKR